MHENEIAKTQVDLDGLLSVLSENLYSTPSIAIRELVQNAQDACFRHRIETGVSDEQYAIHITADEKNKTLSIADNGSGLTVDEIKKYLATIGAGYTRLLRQTTESTEMVGFFGLGFLSSYVVAEKVDVFTTSYQTPDQNWQFSSAKGKSFSIIPFTRTEISRGAEVVLQLKKNYWQFANPANLIDLLSKYCCLLPTPIFINGSPKPINQLIPPWHLRQTLNPIKLYNEVASFASAFESNFEPLFSFMLPENELGLQGVIWIQNGSTYGNRDNRNANIFVRNMFITNEHKDILPEWGGFLGGVLESPFFQPTASRESLQKNNFYEQASELVREQIVIQLRDLILRDNQLWLKIINFHGQALLGAALSDDRLFDVMKKHLKLPTSITELTIPEILKRSNGQIYLSMEENAGHQTLLFTARGVPIVKGYLYAAASFCRYYANVEGIKLIELGHQQDDNSVFIPAELSDEEAQVLTAALCERNEAIKFCKFLPAFVPFIRLVDQQAMLKKQIEEEKSNKIGVAALALAKLHTNTISQRKTHKLFVNLNNPLIDTILASESVERSTLAKLVRAFMDNASQNDSRYLQTESLANSEQATHEQQHPMDIFCKTVLSLIKAKR